jgi:putative oxidoreductase
MVVETSAVPMPGWLPHEEPGRGDDHIAAMCVSRAERVTRKPQTPLTSVSYSEAEVRMTSSSWNTEYHFFPENHLGPVCRDALLLLGRVIMALIFVRSGFGKLVSIEAFGASLASKGVPFAAALAVIGACVEFFGGLAVLAGWQTRYAAALIAVFTVVATLISHRYWEYADAARRAQEVNFQKNLCIFGGYLVLLASGGGRFSLDWLLRLATKRRSTRRPLLLWSTR